MQSVLLDTQPLETFLFHVSASRPVANAKALVLLFEVCSSPPNYIDFKNRHNKP